METENSKNEKKLAKNKSAEAEKKEDGVQKFILIFNHTPKTPEEINDELEDEWGAFTRYANQRKGS